MTTAVAVEAPKLKVKNKAAQTRKSYDRIIRSTHEKLET